MNKSRIRVILDRCFDKYDVLTSEQRQHLELKLTQEIKAILRHCRGNPGDYKLSSKAEEAIKDGLGFRLKRNRED